MRPRYDFSWAEFTHVETLDEPRKTQMAGAMRNA
jgi:hypothetical protein